MHLLHPLTVGQWVKWHPTKPRVSKLESEMKTQRGPSDLHLPGWEKQRKSWSGPNHHQNYPGVRQPRFLALLIPEISFFPPKFMQGLLDLPCAGIRCLNSVGVRNNSLKWLEMPQMQATLQPKPTTAAEIYCSPFREPREFISASNVLFALQKLGGDNTTKVFEIHVKLF